MQKKMTKRQIIIFTCKQFQKHRIWLIWSFKRSNGNRASTFKGNKSGAIFIFPDIGISSLSELIFGIDFHTDIPRYSRF
jgi:hypothetical protein